MQYSHWGVKKGTFLVRLAISICAFSFDLGYDFLILNTHFILNCEGQQNPYVNDFLFWFVSDLYFIQYFHFLLFLFCDSPSEVNRLVGLFLDIHNSQLSSFVTSGPWVQKVSIKKLKEIWRKKWIVKSVQTFKVMDLTGDRRGVIVMSRSK